MNKFKSHIEKLSELAQADPHSAYACMIGRMQHKWTFLQRVNPSTEADWEDLENSIRNKLIPSMTGTSVDEKLRELMSLPVRYGGLGLKNPELEARHQYSNSARISEPLTETLLQQRTEFPADIENEMKRRRNDISKLNDKENETKLRRLEETASASLKRLIQHACRKGSASWLTAKPLADKNMHFNKADFRDLICLRYDIAICDLPRHCVCGQEYTQTHAMSCQTGGFVIRRHNEIRDNFVKLLRDVCNDVTAEPQLLPVNDSEVMTGTTENGSRLDISARNFWRDGQKAFFDIRVFNSTAPTHLSHSLNDVFHRQENEKIRKYSDRIINVEHGSFTPLVFSTEGDSSELTSKFINQLSTMLSQKKSISYADSISWVRRTLSFSLARGRLLCLRGTRRIRSHYTQRHIEDIAIENLSSAN